MVNLNSHFFLVCFDRYMKMIYHRHGLEPFVDKLCDTFDHVYIFSGVIRNFFMGLDIEPKDLDIVVMDDVHAIGPLAGRYDEKMANKFEFIFRLNGMYGYCDMSSNYSSLKYFSKDDFSVDIWDLKDSYGFNGIGTKYYDRTADELVKSPFFNCSAICYDIKKKEFIYTDKFIEFINTLRLSIVNPNSFSDYLQVHKVISYWGKYGLEPDNKLLDFVRAYFFEKHEKPYRKMTINEDLLSRFMAINGLIMPNELDKLDHVKRYFNLSKAKKSKNIVNTSGKVKWYNSL